jgi:hypothetical protein
VVLLAHYLLDMDPADLMLDRLPVPDDGAFVKFWQCRLRKWKESGDDPFALELLEMLSEI